MTEAWGAIVAAVAAGLLAFAGSYWGSRRQATDQAHIEHRQWLRGQHQVTYVAFIGMWDEAVQDLVNLQTSCDARVHEWQQAGDEDWTPGNVAEEILNRVGRQFRQHKEKVDLLGPPSVDKVLKELEGALIGMREEIRSQSLRWRGEPWVDQERWGAVLTRAMEARIDFQAVAVRAVRTPPGPNGEDEV